MPPSPATARWDRYAHPYTTLDVFILSARFGLITAAHPIPNYDQRMTPERTRDLRPAIVATLAQIFDAKTYNRAHLAVGKDYLAALDGLLGAISREATITVATGSQCKRLAQLHDWLYELETPAASRSPETRRTRQHRENSRLNGVEITLTADQALAHARQAVAADSHGCDRFRSWYVLLDEERIAPKWLVSRFSGLSVGAFTTQEALRALAQIGITVHCVESL